MLRRACLGALLLGITPLLHAQFWVRDSTVLPDSVTGGGTHSGSSAHVGPFDITTSVYAGLEFNDNITLSPSGDSGLALRTGITTSLRYPVSHNNELTFDASLERLTYLSGGSGSESYNSVLPGTATTFTIFIGQVRIRNFLKVALSEDPVNSPVINRTARFGRFNADAGTQIDWDMNRVIWQLTGAVGRQLATQSVNRQIDFWHYAVGLRALFPLGPGASWGLSTTYSINRYDETIQNDSHTRSAGVFSELELSRSVRAEAAAGIQKTDYSASGSISDRTDYNGLYASASLTHQLNRTLSYTLSLRHDIDEGYGTNFYRITEIALTPSLKLGHKWDLVGNFSYQWIDESGSAGESATRLGLGLEARRPLGRKLDGVIGIARYQKFSDIAGRDYEQDRIYFSLRYTF